jgi:hypothetical protein
LSEFAHNVHESATASQKRFLAGVNLAETMREAASRVFLESGRKAHDGISGGGMAITQSSSRASKRTIGWLRASCATCDSTTKACSSWESKSRVAISSEYREDARFSIPAIR